MAGCAIPGISVRCQPTATGVTEKQPRYACLPMATGAFKTGRVRLASRAREMTACSTQPTGEQRMRAIGGLALAIVIAVAMAGGAAAQDIPNCPVKIIVSGPPGGTPDLIARLGAEKISAGIGRPVVVENRAGGLGAITSVEAVKASEIGRAHV